MTIAPLALAAGHAGLYCVVGVLVSRWLSHGLLGVVLWPLTMLAFVLYFCVNFPRVFHQVRRSR